MSEFVSVILLIWTHTNTPIKIDLPDMPTCVAMQEQITAQNTNTAHLYTRCVGVPKPLGAK